METLVEEIVRISCRKAEHLFEEVDVVWGDHEKEPRKLLIMFSDGERVVVEVLWLD